MPLPGNITLVTVEGTYMDLKGNARVGSVSFSIEGALVNPSAKVVITSGTVEAELKNGHFSIQLPATDDPDVSPTGFSYRVTEQFQDGGGRPPFNLSLPSTITQPVDVSQISLTAPPNTGTVNYITLEALQAEAGNRAAGDEAILASKGAANGIAPLDELKKVPVLYLPDQSGNYVPVAQKGAANGVATLGENAKIPAAQYDAAIILLASQRGAANGVPSLDGSVKIPLSQIPNDPTVVHTTGGETITGAKTFSGASGATLLGVRVSADANNRVAFDTLGNISWGPGNTSSDVSLVRAATKMLRVLGGLESSGSALRDTAFATNVAGDAFDRWRLHSDGGMDWGTGAAARDVNLYRGGPNQLRTDSNLQANNFPAGAWTSYTPTWASTQSGTTNPTLGNSLVGCKYTKIGRTVIVIFTVVFGSTATFGSSPGTGNNWVFGLPVKSANEDLCMGYFDITRNNEYRCVARAASHPDMNSFYLEVTSGSPNASVIQNSGYIDAVSPWTWLAGYKIYGTLTYEAAS